MKRCTWFIIVFAHIIGCVANPQPEPALRPVDVERLLLSSPGDDRSSIVAGHGGAAPGAGFVVVRHLGRDESLTTATAVDGSFSATLEAEAGDEIGLVFRNDSGVESDEVVVIVPDNALSPLEPPTLDPLFPPDRFGLVVVSGGPGAATTDTEVVATNLDQPSTSSVGTSADGSFVLDIIGASNETLAVFVVDATDRNRASAPVTAQIPEPEPSTEDCLNGVDDDGDTFIDCDDPDCEDFCRCPDGQTFCDGLCTDTDTDPDNCGRCGNICPLSGPNCIAGDCVR